MLLSELKDTLQKLKNQKFTNEFFAKLYGTSSQNISKRINNKSEVTVRELEIAQEATGVLIYIKTNDNNYKITKNSLERRNNVTVAEKLLTIGNRLKEIQNKHEYLDKDMAKLLKISEDDYIGIKSGKNNLNISIISSFKQLFEISTDWLLFGD